MSLRLRRSVHADRDVAKLVEYVSRDSVLAAIKLSEAIDETEDIHTENPELGQIYTTKRFAKL